MKSFILLFLISSILLQCQSQKEPMPTTDFYISEQKITYKGQDLPFGKPVEEWVKIFGNYDRVFQTSIYVWDELGISVKVAWGDRPSFNKETDEEIAKEALSTPIGELHLYFLNLESPLAEEGVLDYAEGYYMKTDKSPKNYVYPFTIYSKPINIEGTEVKQGMTISQINQERKSRDLTPISYIDANLDGKLEGGSLTTKSNGYFSKYGLKESPQGPNQKVKKNFYHIMFRQTSGEVEYIRVVYDTGQVYFKI